MLMAVKHAVGRAAATLACFALTALAWGCGPSGAYDVRDADVAIEPGLFVGLVTHSERGPQQNALDAPLKSGDRVALLVGTDDRRYVYLVNVAPSGEAQLLDAAAFSGTERFPDSGWYELVAPSGHELLAIVATRKPIDVSGHKGKKDLLNRIVEMQQRDDLSKLQSALPPGFAHGHATMGFRGIDLFLDGGAVRTLDGDSFLFVLVAVDLRPGE